MIKTTVNDDGSSSVEIISEEPLLDENGEATAEMQSSQWNCNDLKHTERLIPTWKDPERPAAMRLRPGDESAMRDQINEIKKQLRS